MVHQQNTAATSTTTSGQADLSGGTRSGDSTRAGRQRRRPAAAPSATAKHTAAKTTSPRGFPSAARAKIDMSPVRFTVSARFRAGRAGGRGILVAGPRFSHAHHASEYGRKRPVLPRANRAVQAPRGGRAQNARPYREPEGDHHYPRPAA